MKQDILSTHGSEIAREIRAGRYEETERGILLTRPELFIGGAIRARLKAPGEPWSAPQIAHNKVPAEARRHILNLTMPPTAGYPPITKWYLAPFKNDYDPETDDNLTAATFKDTAGEFLDYTSPTRPEVVVPNAAAGNSIGGNEVQFTVSGAGPFTVYGGALLSSSVKGSVTGKILAGTRLDFPFLNLMPGYRFSLEYILSALDA